MKKILTFIIAITVCWTYTQAQQAVVAAGGESKNQGASLSYSVGQVVYSPSTNSNTGSVLAGVQQPHEIYEITSISNNYKNEIILSVYPNPTVEHINLEIKYLNLENLRFSVIDIAGNTLIVQKITSKNTIIDLSTYPSASYFLKVSNDKVPVKTFKILKK